MKTGLNWLNLYLDTPVTADEADDLLMAAGFPIESREAVAGLGGADELLDVEVTSNRPDVLSHVGVAREIAARGSRTLKRPVCEAPDAGDPEVGGVTRVENQQPDLCPGYTARVIQGVRVGPSPDWLRQAIESVGGRSVNNVVDVTNYVLLELGQPLHAFDLAKLSGQRIVVRMAKDGETFEAIDDSKHKLAASMLVIADAEKPVAVAGVMGGKGSEVGAGTTDLLIESAVFDPLSVRRTSRRLKLASDSSFRFERGVDPVGVDEASRRACELILQVAGGTLCEGVITVGDAPAERHTITLRAKRTEAILGIGLPIDQQAALLEALEVSCAQQGETLVATIPTHRLDLVREIDLIEEIARQYGLDNIPLKSTIDIVTRHPQESVKASRLMAQVLVAHGYHETITPSLMSPEDAEPFAEAASHAALTADMRRADNTLRPSVLASLMRCRKHNQDAGNKDVKLFEVASAWSKREGKVAEGHGLTLLRDAPDGASAVSQIKGTIEELVHTLGGDEAVSTLRFEPIEDPLYEVAVVIKLGELMAGSCGMLASRLADHFDINTPQASALICTERFMALYPPKHEASALPKYPAIERDLSIVVEEQVAWLAVARTIEKTSPEMLESTRFVGTYRGKQVGKGKKSVTFRMAFRDPNTTLRHEQVDPQVAAVVAALGKSVSAEVRG